MCMLALLELGIPFVNIDKAIPEERVQYMFQTVGVHSVVVDEKLEMDGIETIDVATLSFSCKTIRTDKNKSQYAYYLFTSRTTGNPKAVPILRESLENFFDGISNRINFKSGQRILNLKSYSFDIVFLETLYALYTGLTVVLTNDEQVGNIKEIVDVLVEDCVEIVQMTPSRLKMFAMVDSSLSYFSKLKFVLIGGEAFPVESLKLLQQCTSASIYNMYGPTETTIWSTISELTDKEYIDIGQAILNTDIYILDENDSVISDGKEGEICIAGKGLSTGYVNNDEATAKAFINITIEGKEVRLYKTGDMGRIDESGLIYCFGRKDNQVKYNGHRIELEDIDRNIHLMPGVEQTVTCFDKVKNHFITYYIAEEEVENSTFINFLSQKLPDSIVFMEILVEIEAEFGFEFDVDKLSMNEYETVENLIQFARQKSGK